MGRLGWRGKNSGDRCSRRLNEVLALAVAGAVVLGSLSAADRGHAAFAFRAGHWSASCRIAQHFLLPKSVQLSSIAVIDPATIYVVGSTVGGALQHSLIERRNGDKWVRIRTPDVGLLDDISGKSRNNIWAMGDRAALHWNGRTWRRVRVPAVDQKGGLSWFRMAATRTGVWAIGTGGGVAVVGRWDGKRWRSWRNRELTEYVGITAVSETDVWVVGSRYDDSPAPLLMHWNGRRWRSFDIPGDLSIVAIEAIDATASNNVWAVGEAPDDQTGFNEGVVFRWDGTKWQALDDATIANPYGLNSPGHSFLDYTSIDAVNTETAWVGGYELRPGLPTIPLTILATRPSSLIPMPLPNLDAYIYEIDGANATTAWAVGATSIYEKPREENAQEQALIERVECA